MNKIRFVIAISIFLIQCKSEKKNEINYRETKSKVVEEPKKNIEKIDFKSGLKTFDFKNFRQFDLKDTIKMDLNGNGLIEKIYFSENDCKRIIIEELGSEMLSIGCENNEYLKFPNQVEWVDQWCIVSDKEVREVLFIENGDIDKDSIFTLERPSIYIGKKEAGGGIITYKKGKIYWVHQAD